MDKKFNSMFTELGLAINKDYAYGILKGYEVNIKQSNLNAPPFVMHISFYATEEQKQEIDNKISTFATKFLKYNYTSYGMVVELSDFTISKLASKVPETMNNIIDAILNSGALGAKNCPVCGKELDTENKQVVTVDNFCINLDKDCLLKINNEIETQNKQFESKPNNYFKGFLGALVGGLAGFALSFIFYMCGFISAISAFVAITVGTLLYQKFGGKQNKMMILIVSITSILFMILSIFSVYIYSAGSAARELGYAMNAFEAFGKLMADNTFASMFYKDLILTLVFSVVGIVGEIIVLIKNVKRPTKIQ